MNLFLISVLKSPLVHRLLVSRKQDVAVQSQFLAAFLNEDLAVTTLPCSRLFAALFGVACCVPSVSLELGALFWHRRAGRWGDGQVGSVGTELLSLAMLPVGRSTWAWYE